MNLKWRYVFDYASHQQDHAEILRDRIVDGTLEEDYLWAWLNGTSVFFEDKQASWLITR